MIDLTRFEPKKILVCQQRQIGDVLLSTPVFQLLKQRFPQAEVHLFTETKCEPLLRHNPHIDKFHLIDRKLGFFGQLAFYRKVAAQQFDMVINLQQLPRCIMMTMMSGAPVRLSFPSSPLRDRVYTHLVPEVKGYASMSKISLLKDLGITWNGEAPRIYFTEEEGRQARALLASCGLKEGEKLVTIDATHRRATKRWAKENFARLIAMLAEYDDSLRFFLLRGPGEEEELKPLIEACPVREKLLMPDAAPDIRLSAAVIREAVIHIGNGSSPQHMAVASDTPSLIVPGPEGPWWTYPGPMHDEIVVDLPCRPCHRHECDDMRCMTLVTPDMVFKRAVELMQG